MKYILRSRSANEIDCMKEEKEFDRQKEYYEDNRKDGSQKDLGDQIGDLIQDAIDAMDFEGLSKNIRKTVNQAREEVSRQIKEARQIQEEWRYNAKDHYGWSWGQGSSGRHKKGVERPQRYRKEEGQKEGELVPSGRIKKLPGSVSGPLQIGFGAFGLGVFGSLSLGFGIAGVGLGLLGGMVSAASVILESIFVPLTVLSGVFLGRGIIQGNRAKRIRQYAKLWTGKSFITLKELENRSGRSMKRICKDVEFVMDEQLLPEASMDDQRTCLILTEEARQQYEMAKQAQREREEEIRRQEEAQKLDLFAAKAGTVSEDAAFREFQEQAGRYLSKIQEKKREITSQVMMPKLEELELVLTRIFVCVKENPEKAGQTDRLMGYYLPAVIKLLRVYADFEKQPIQGENIQKTKKEIEDSLDMMNQALTSMFDDMFQDVAMDISSDIRVLEMMLARDGWTGQDFTPSDKDRMF